MSGNLLKQQGQQAGITEGHFGLDDRSPHWICASVQKGHKKVKVTAFVVHQGIVIHTDVVFESKWWTGKYTQNCINKVSVEFSSYINSTSHIRKFQLIYPFLEKLHWLLGKEEGPT